jgi:hypothetical protein
LVNWTNIRERRITVSFDQIRRKSMSHVGRCFCGAVEVEVTGEPEAMGYCHCSSCRSWSAGPVNAFTLWKEDAVKIKAGAEHLGSFEKTSFS